MSWIARERRSGMLGHRAAGGMSAQLLMALLMILPFVANIAVAAPAASKGHIIDLDGKWDFRFDKSGVGEQARWFNEKSPNGWDSIQVPGSYNIQFPSNNAYEGKGWYRTSFHVKQKPGEHAFLHLEGVVLRSLVWVNGHKAGESVLAFTPVDFDVTAFLCQGECENLIVIETDNEVLSKAIPDSKWTGWLNTGGLIWPVSLRIKPSIYGTAHVQTSMVDGGWQSQVSLTLHSDAAHPSALVDAAIMDGNRVIWKGIKRVQVNQGETSVSLSARLEHIKPWSPDTPCLYRFQAKVRAEGVGTMIDDLPFGFREIKVAGSELMLNGKKLTLRGINRHSFYPGVGMSVPAEQTLNDLEAIKALNANFVRLAHYSQPEEVYEDCDKLGLLVWTEIPAWQTASSVLDDTSVWQAYAEPLLHASVINHWNHPSVIVWSVANEIASDKPEGAKFVAKAVAYVKQLDSSRLVTFASDKREHDISFGPVDFIAINEYYGWYYGEDFDLGPVLDLVHKQNPNKPIFVSEYGAESRSGWTRTDPKSRDYSFEHQALFLKRHLDQIYAPSRQRFMAGGAPWLFNDFPLPYPHGKDFQKVPPTINAKGLVTPDRARKPAWDTVANFYRTLDPATK